MYQPIYGQTGARIEHMSSHFQFSFLSISRVFLQVIILPFLRASKVNKGDSDLALFEFANKLEASIFKQQLTPQMYFSKLEDAIGHCIVFDYGVSGDLLRDADGPV